MTAYFVDTRWTGVSIYEFSYTKRTDKSYCGCVHVRNVVGSYPWHPKTIAQYDASDSLTGALAMASEFLSHQIGIRQHEIDNLQRQLDTLTILGQREQA